MKKISGIYIIKNNINDKVYIGSAVNCHRRFIQHKSDFNKQCHNQRFQNFVNKYGIDTLIFEIIEIVENKEHLIDREQYGIDYYKSYNPKKGYNICKTAGSTLGCKMPISHKKSCKNRMFDNKYRLGKKWSDKEKKEIGQRSKMMWMNNPEKKKEMGKKISDLKKGVSIWDENRPHPMKGKIHPNRKHILVYKEGVLIDKCFGTKEVCNKYKLDRAAVVRVCNGKSKTTKGYVLKYFEPSSKMCTCGYINHNLTLAMREWICPKCGSIHDRDLLAANNIKRFAFRNINTVGTTEIYACGDMSEDAHSAQEAHESSVRG